MVSTIQSWLISVPKPCLSFQIGEAVASLALEYLNLSFDESVISELPQALTSMKDGLLERLRSRRSEAHRQAESSLPPGFDLTETSLPTHPKTRRVELVFLKEGSQLARCDY